MKKYIWLLMAIGTIGWLSSCNKVSENKAPVDYVNPYIGNISHLLVPTFPTVHLPNSMLRVYPERREYTTDYVSGLPVIVTSHRGHSAFRISPKSGTLDDTISVMGYTYDNERITPYRYSTYLDEAKVEVDFAPSHQSAVYNLKFAEANENLLLIYSQNGALNVSGQTVSGYEIIGNGSVKVYLYLETEQPVVKSGVVADRMVQYDRNSTQKKGESIALQFDSKQINLRYGVSFISEEQARRNLHREIETYRVDDVAQIGRDIWNKTLGKIVVDGSSESDKTVFYTSLYRTYERMINISEDGKYYSAFDGKVHEDGGIAFYTDDWIWDTYRATHPLRILIEPEMETAMINSYLRMANQTKEGWMPTFPEVTGDSHRMNGNHAVAVICDAYYKGLHGFDLQTAYDACKGALTEKSLLPWLRIPNTELDDFYRDNGYFPALQPDEEEYVKAVHGHEKRQPVAVTLGTCYDDWCLSRIAKVLGKDNDYDYFFKRSLNYRNIYNTETGFFHPKDKHGAFIAPFDYRYAGGQGARNYYGENNGWIYRWDVPHNVDDLIRLMGSRQNFTRNLDQMFREPLGKNKYTFYAQLPDHTGNVGQYSMANEPSLHIPYLYNYAGTPWKTQKRIRRLLEQWFRNDLMGMPGDEDGGCMTAFVVFSAMGFYPVTPGLPVYNIGSPLFEHIKIDLGNGVFFEIEAHGCSKEHKYIQAAWLNGQEWNKPWFSHDDIKNGGKLILIMGDKANENWGTKSVPPSGGTFHK